LNLCDDFTLGLESLIGQRQRQGKILMKDPVEKQTRTSSSLFSHPIFAHPFYWPCLESLNFEYPKN
jgi:hypothetical protein